ncbi:unnamed protein product [Effrenium voratum]|uniref:Uncharacterized protein n=1 Tax=Effrenium voratum TaxID=2562239 RepID=A0AA36IFB9_9DINO|nr:unnamed protein product [Effrenium voratum]
MLARGLTAAAIARATTCSSGRAEDCSALEVPVDTRPCFSAASCAWRFDAWQPCNVSCGIGWQERTIWCPTGTDADCPHTRPNRLQRCHSQVLAPALQVYDKGRKAGCQWLPSAWGACSGVCEPGTRSRNITCSSQEESDCAQVPRPADREACNTHAAGCAWDLGVWSPCSATSCGGLGSRVRSVGCRSQHGDAGCFGEKPREVEPCLSETTCVWQISEWDACDASCGWGVRSRLVQCSSPQEECGEKPASTEACYSCSTCTAGCAWWTSQWSRCNATCGLGLQTRDLICGTDACDPSTAPSRFRNCSSIAECAWEVGEWGLCSGSARWREAKRTACGRGVLERPVACPSGFDADCAARGIPRPMDRRECTNTTGGEDGDCPSPKPSDLKSCAETVGCAWQIGEWSACAPVEEGGGGSVACGQGLRTRTLSCEGPLESCGERPPEAENCTGLACGWRVGNWQSCNASCGHGLQMRSVECLLDLNADARGGGGGDEPGGCVGAGPATWQACVSRDACRWHSGQWSNCSEGCGLGTRSRQVLCSGGSVQLCSEWPRPADAESCSQENRLGPSCGWSVGAWSTTCGDKCGPHLREVFCAGHCFGRAPEGAKPCEVQARSGSDPGVFVDRVWRRLFCQDRFDLSLRLENPSEQLLEELVAGTRQELRWHLAQTGHGAAAQRPATDWMASINVSVPPDWRRILLVVAVVFPLDFAWYALMMFSGLPIYPLELFDTVVLPFGLLAWTPWALSLSAGQNFASWKEAAAFGAFVGFTVFGTFQGTALTFFPSYRVQWWTPLVDLVWGTSSGALTVVLADMLYNRCCNQGAKLPIAGVE